MDPLSLEAEDAMELAVMAAEAIEDAAKAFGRSSEDERLARAIYDQWEGQYQALRH